MLGRTLSGHFSMGMLWAAHNENRQPFLRAAFLLSASFDHFNTMHLRAFGILVLLAEEAVLLLIAFRIKTPALRIVVGVAVALLASSVGQWESMLLEENWMFFLTVAGAATALVLLERQLQTRPLLGNGPLTLVGVAAAATVASLSLAGGLVTWPVLVLRAATYGPYRRHLRVAGLLAGAGVVESVLYAWDMPGGGLGTRTAFHQPLLLIVKFFVLCMGASLYNVGASSARFVAGEIIGSLFTLGLVACVVAAWRSQVLRRDPLFGLGLALAVFGTGEALFIEYGRITMGITLAFGSRYTTLTQTVPIGLLFCAAAVVDRRLNATVPLRARQRGLVALAGVVGVVALMGFGVSLNDESQWLDSAHYAFYFQSLTQDLTTTRPVSDAQLNAFEWAPATIRSAEKVLRRFHLSVYAGRSAVGPPATGSAGP